jgi:hypothetical protein
MPAKKKASARRSSSSKRRSMSAAHKTALAKGREQGRAVRAYLEALEANRPRRGRRRTPASIKARLQTIERQLPDADALKRVQLFQERMDLEFELERVDATVDIAALERAFTKNVKAYSESKGLTHSAWREAGVPAAVLQKAALPRTRRT